jgi:hypothetical protein
MYRPLQFTATFDEQGDRRFLGLDNVLSLFGFLYENRRVDGEFLEFIVMTRSRNDYGPSSTEAQGPILEWPDRPGGFDRSGMESAVKNTGSVGLKLEYCTFAHA